MRKGRNSQNIKSNTLPKKNTSTNKLAKDTSLSVVEQKAVAKALAQEEKKKVANQNSLMHLRHIQEVRCKSLQDSYEIEKSLENYFGICSADNIMPTASGIALALGIRRSDLLEWANGTKPYPNRDIIVKYFSLLEVYDEIAMKEGTIPPLIAIFNAKNNYGYKDEVKVNTASDDLSDEEIERRYREKHEIVSEQYGD